MGDQRHPLERALNERENACYAAIDKLRDIAPSDIETEVHELTSTLRDAVYLVSCLRRLTRGRSPREIHDAFGAPGDFGYQTPLGDALFRLYSTPSESEEP